jgi:phosphotransferase system enzyme I (PtsI)
MTLALSGIGVSKGVAIGRAFLLIRELPEIIEATVPPENVRLEIKRFRRAIAIEREKLAEIKERIPSETPVEIASFIDTHLLMLDDSTLSEAPVRVIREQQCTAEWALKVQRDRLVSVFDEMEDPYLRTRRDDVDHVIKGVQRILMRIEHGDDGGRVQAAWRDRIVVADDLTPADTLLMQQQGIAGFITEVGGPTSHTAILARSLGIPAIVGVHGVQRYLKDLETLIVDGDHGLVLAGTDEKELAFYRRKRREQRRRQAELEALRTGPAITADGREIRLFGNVELSEDLRVLRRLETSGIGLYRTEFLFLNRPDLPSEEEQFRVFRRVVRAMKGKPVTIRTLDLGADKTHWLQVPSLAAAHNPALGLRAIRYCLHDHELFLPHLRAIMRAAAHGPVNLMLPMLTSVSELNEALELIEQAKAGLRKRGYRFNPAVPVGGMIEVPAAAVAADVFARHLDFLSIGTNDLIQYTLAIDRIDDQVNYLYDPLHPALLRLIDLTIRAGEQTGIPVSMCGELAGHPRFTRLLIGMGLQDFSMQPSSILEIKHLVKTSDYAQLRQQVREVLDCHDSRAIHELVDKINLPTPH